ncbi:hypothetical protein C900_00521 [Fulvivirga imtechensis AK7]|uniref:Uncharacterized protein n=1 Tax=Fulvivirga imtechensis AK7 TaxID=1237149 RepID=L8JJC4_9BACT|nr:hypothetical protein C900_00521 [Fulvivirga imtechensis AK7]
MGNRGIIKWKRLILEGVVLLRLVCLISRLIAIISIPPDWGGYFSGGTVKYICKNGLDHD